MSFEIKPPNGGKAQTHTKVTTEPIAKALPKADKKPDDGTKSATVSLSQEGLATTKVQKEPTSEKVRESFFGDGNKPDLATQAKEEQEAVEERKKELIENAQQNQRRLRFVQKDDEIIVEVRDKKTDEVVRKIPNEDVQEILSHLKKLREDGSDPSHFIETNV